MKQARNEMPGDWRSQAPRFQGANLAANVARLRPLEEMAAKKGVATSSVAIAWILRRGDDLVPLGGMGRPENVERNLEALHVPLDEADMAASRSGGRRGHAASAKSSPHQSAPQIRAVAVGQDWQEF